MPELPDLEILRERLAPSLTRQAIVGVRVRRPLIVRNLLGGELGDRLVGRAFTEVTRRGKFLLLRLDGGLVLAVNPMLAGRLRCGPPLPRDRARDALILSLGNGQELRYHDAKDMGKVYLTADLEQIPAYAGMGPEADDPTVTAEVFAERLRKHPGEIKTALLSQRFLAGIGNAYADEILWRAGLYPFRRVSSLSAAEVAALHAAMRETLAKAISILRERLGEDTELELRDFLSVHGKPGQPCPRCGSTISEVTRERRATHFCRTCQPGLLVGRG